MKILLLTQWFEPEPCFKGLSFARELQRSGHEVSVLTGFPNYPGGKVYPPYQIRLWQRDVMDGISILRVPLYPSHDRSAFRRILNYCSFALAAAVGIFTLPRPDVVYAYSPPPTTAMGAVLLLAFRRVPFVLDVQDMWPDTLDATGMVRHAALFHLIERWLRLVYRSAARVVVLSEGFKRILVERGVPAERIRVIPNWTDESMPAILPSSPPSDDGHFNIVYAGNLGLAQDLGVVIEAARRLQKTAPQVRFLIAGDGVNAAELRAAVETEALENISFLGRLPMTQMPDLFARAQALLVHLRDEPIFRVTIPSKTQAYLRAGKPILMGVRGDAAKLVEQAGAGLAFEPGDATALENAVLQITPLSPERRNAMGNSGADYYRRFLSMEAGARAFSALFEQVVAGPARAEGEQAGNLR